MPARRRSKVGETRKDAALDAMRTFGFPDNLTRTTLSQLLKVYGKDGWAFIEDSGYRVLTEAILEAIEQKQPDQDGKDVGHQPDQDGKDATQVLADQRNLIHNHPCQDEEASVEKKDFAQHIYESDVAGGNTIINYISEEEPIDNATQVLADQHNLILNHPCQDEEASGEKKDFAQHIYESDVAGGNTIINYISEEEPIDEEALVAVKKCLVHQVIVPCKKCTSDAIKAIRCVDKPRRKPCFGWISDSEDDGLVTLARSDQ